MHRALCASTSSLGDLKCIPPNPVRHFFNQCATAFMQYLLAKPVQWAAQTESSNCQHHEATQGTWRQARQCNDRQCTSIHHAQTGHGQLTVVRTQIFQRTRPTHCLHLDLSLPASSPTKVSMIDARNFSEASGCEIRYSSTNDMRSAFLKVASSTSFAFK